MTDPVCIQLDLQDNDRQVIQVRQCWTPSSHRLSFQLPVWTPGSYTVRDHVQHLNSLRLWSGTNPVAVKRTGPSAWSADLPDLTPLTLTYCLEARDLTVRTCYVDSCFASLCMAAVAMHVDDQRWHPHHLQVLAPEPWNVHVPLEKGPDGWLAADFDALVDSPLHAGEFDLKPFEVEGHRHDLLLIGTPPGGWPEHLSADVASVCSAVCRLMGTAPPAGDRYQLVIQMLEQGYGGLEHDHSAVLQFNWQALAKPDGRRQLLQLVGHEYLHQWNVRRLRPVEYRPYDYARPVVSEGLWFAEGITSYFDLTTTLIAGFSDRSTFLKDLGQELSRVLMTPGRSLQSLSDSAKEAWVKLYKATPASRDSQVSYYGLGAATAFCLDVRLRQAESSLAEVLRELWSSHGLQGRGYSRQHIQAALAGHTSTLSADLNTWLDQPASLPLKAVVADLGLRLDSVPSDRPHHGLTLKDEQGQVLVKRVASDGPGADSALVPGDELLAVNGYRLRRAADLALLLQCRSAACITYVRRGRLAETRLNPDKGVDHWLLDWDPGANADQRALRDRWFQIL